jgi:peptidoglycan hydrolase-like protein with peptidoglycan-binding domain
MIAALVPASALAATGEEIPNERQAPLPPHARQHPAPGGVHATATSLGPRTLREGMNGEDVAVIQARLSRRGYGLTLDGDFGPKTKRAVIAFQRAQGLPATGVVGAAVRARLNLRRQPPSAPIKRRTTMSGSWLASIPGTGGIRVDRRIRPDVESLIVYYDLAVTAGYATSGHATNGEHPLGLALDAVPADGNWDRARKLAEDFGWRSSCGGSGCVGTLDEPFRFIGYNGYPGHGDPAHAGGNAHLHLSWQHTPAAPGSPAARVQTLLPPPGEKRP